LKPRTRSSIAELASIATGATGAETDLAFLRGAMVETPCQFQDTGGTG
jgi:hypothetical protein